MTFNSILFESIPQAKYLSADNYLQYRAIMRLFYQEHQKMHYQLDQKTILTLLREDSIFVQYTPEQLTMDLSQLVSWKNLTPIQDPHKTYTILDFKNKQFQYMMSQAAIEIERMTITLENLYTRASGLSTSVFRRLYASLHTLGSLDEYSLKEVSDWWQDIQEDFNRLSQNHQDYLREFYGPGVERQISPADFIVYKQHLIRYLEEFVQDLQSSSTQIGALLKAVSPEQEKQILALVHRSALEVAPRPQSEMTGDWEERLRQQEQGVWQSLIRWFLGENSTAKQVMEVTNEVIRRVVQNAALLVQMQNMGVSNKTQLRHLLGLFAQCDTLDEAHRLSAQVFGAQRVRHFAVNAPRETDRIDSSVYEEAPMDYTLQPRVRTYKPRLDRSGFADKQAEKEAQRQVILQQQQQLRQELDCFIQDGLLDFSTIATPVPPHIRTVLLSWVAMANLSPDKQGHTEYGQAFTLRQRDTSSCRLSCTDGDLIMPNYVLVFREDSYV